MSSKISDNGPFTKEITCSVSFWLYFYAIYHSILPVVMQADSRTNILFWEIDEPVPLRYNMEGEEKGRRYL